MSRYLTIARSVSRADEINEISLVPVTEPDAIGGTWYEINEESPVMREEDRTHCRPKRLSPSEAISLGLDPALPWVVVSRD